MSDAEVKRQLAGMLAGLTPGSILHLLGEVLRDGERLRVGQLDQVAEERLALAEAALVVFGIGLDSVCHR